MQMKMQMIGMESGKYVHVEIRHFPFFCVMLLPYLTLVLLLLQKVAFSCFFIKTTYTREICENSNT